MSRRVMIETPFPSLEETARTLGVSRAAVERVQRLLSQPERRTHGRANRHQATSNYARKRASKKR